MQSEYGKGTEKTRIPHCQTQVFSTKIVCAQIISMQNLNPIWRNVKAGFQC